jgi:hypothetical protein
MFWLGFLLGVLVTLFFSVLVVLIILGAIDLPNHV